MTTDDSLSVGDVGRGGQGSRAARAVDYLSCLIGQFLITLFARPSVQFRSPAQPVWLMMMMHALLSLSCSKGTDRCRGSGVHMNKSFVHTMPQQLNGNLPQHTTSHHFLPAKW